MQLIVFTANADDFLGILDCITNKRLISMGAKGHLYSITTGDPETAKLLFTSVLNIPDCEVALRT